MVSVVAHGDAVLVGAGETRLSMEDGVDGDDEGIGGGGDKRLDIMSSSPSAIAVSGGCRFNDHVVY